MPRKSTNIIITGFMATGKSTVGQILAARLQRPFIDTDAVISRKAGLSIPEIFEQYGEEDFRKREKEFLVYLQDKVHLVVATGGGMLVPPANLQLALETNWVVCLNASPEEIEQRIGKEDNRPLASEWEKVWEERQEFYQKIPIQVDTNNKEPLTIAEEIEKLWKKK